MQLGCAIRPVRGNAFDSKEIILEIEEFTIGQKLENYLKAETYFCVWTDMIMATISKLWKEFYTLYVDVEIDDNQISICGGSYD